MDKKESSFMGLVGFEYLLRGEKKLLLEQENLDSVLKFCHGHNFRVIFLFYFQHFCHSGNAVLTKLRLHTWCNKNDKKEFHWLISDL